MFENFSKELDETMIFLQKKKSEIESSTSNLSEIEKAQFKQFNETFSTLAEKKVELKNMLNDLNVAKSKVK